MNIPGLGGTLGLLPVAVGGLFLIFLFFIMISRMLRWIVKIPPNKAMIVFGVRTKSKINIMRRVPVIEETPTGHDEQVRKFETRIEEQQVEFRIVRGGWSLVVPLIHTVQYLDLSLMTLEVKVENVLSSQAVPITVDGIAQIKIGGDDTFIATAAEQLLEKSSQDLEYSAKETLMGHLRAIIGTMTVEEVYKDRERFAQEVLNVAVDDLAGMGWEIVSFTIKDIDDTQGYIKALGRPEIANKLRDARVAEADADREATQKEQGAEKLKAEATKDTNVAQAQYDSAVAKEQAVAERSKDISLAEQDKTLEQKKAEAAKQAAIRRNEELEAEVRRPADATLYAKQKEADGTKAVGFAAAEVTAKTGQAEAESNKAKGIAEADVIEARLTAEAEGQKKLGQSLNSYQDSALRYVLGQKLLENIPGFAEAIAGAFANIDQIRLIDIGGGGSEDGTGPLDRFLKTIPDTVFNVLQQATALIGAPIDDLVTTLVTEKAKEQGIELNEEEKKSVKQKVSERVEVAKIAVSETPKASESDETSKDEPASEQSSSEETPKETGPSSEEESLQEDESQADEEAKKPRRTRRSPRKSGRSLGSSKS